MAIASRGTDDSPSFQRQGLADWRATYQRLGGRDRASLTAVELDALAEALFWLDRPGDSVAVRRDAYAAHVEADSPGGAAMAAWQLYFDHALVGELAVANGWLERARDHVGARDGSVIDGFVAVAEADRAQLTGRVDDALAHAERGVGIGRASAHRDLLAMALQTHGRLLVALDLAAEGFALLDEAMVAVINGELSPLFTGWVYCAVLGVCHDVADLRRAAEWTDAALRWCETNHGSLYPGLCRVHRVELACLSGAWDTAETEARRASDELLTHDPRYAGEAVYLAAELARLRGDLKESEDGFRRAHELGRDPQPGLALVWLAQGKAASAAAALRLALHPGPSAPLGRAGLLAALVEAELAAGGPDRAEVAVRELAAVAERTASPYLEATAAARDGLVRLARDDVEQALACLRRACAVLKELAMPYEAARAQAAIGIALGRAGDPGGAELELQAAEATFQRLGARLDVERTRDLLAPERPAVSPLTSREVEVLRLVAQGQTNRQIAADLRISEHTVSRHLSNIFTKLGVGSRAAATAFAYEHRLM